MNIKFHVIKYTQTYQLFINFNVKILKMESKFLCYLFTTKYVENVLACMEFFRK